MNTKLKSVFIALLAVLMACGAGSAALAAGTSDLETSLKDVTTLAGKGDFRSDDGSALSATFRSPQGLTVLKDGAVLVADTRNHLIRQIRSGQVTTYAGVTFDTDERGFPIGGLVDGPLAQSVFQHPADIEADASGNLFVADSANHVIRKIDPSGNVTVYAGDPDGSPGSEDGRGTAAKFDTPSGIAITPNGTIYVADTMNHVIRRISNTGHVTTLNSASERAVEVTPGQIVPAGDFRDGSLGEALFNEPTSLAVDAKGNLYVSDSGNQLIRYIDLAAGVVTTVAGGSEAVYEDDGLYAIGDYIDGPAADARFDFPKGLALTATGELLIADSINHAIRLLADGNVSTVVGTPTAEHGNADGTELSARLHHPTDVAIADNGDIYVADAYNNKIRSISAYALPAELKRDGTIQVVDKDGLIAFDAQPEKVNSRVMVPVRAIAESLGYEVETSDNVKVVLTREETTIELFIGSANVRRTVGATVTDSQVDAVPYIKNNRTYVPVRFVSEQLNKQVDWIQQFQTVIIR